MTKQKLKQNLIKIDGNTNNVITDEFYNFKMSTSVSNYKLMEFSICLDIQKRTVKWENNFETF